jgi:hypothetical protein
VCKAARNRYHEVRNPAAAQPTPTFPVKGWVDPATGQRLRRECLGEVRGRELSISNFVRSTGVDLYYRRSMGNPRRPQPNEIDHSLCRTLLDTASAPARTTQLHPLWQFDLVSVDAARRVRGRCGSALYRFRPVITRPGRRWTCP